MGVLEVEPHFLSQERVNCSPRYMDAEFALVALEASDPTFGAALPHLVQVLAVGRDVYVAIRPRVAELCCDKGALSDISNPPSVTSKMPNHLGSAVFEVGKDGRIKGQSDTWCRNALTILEVDKDSQYRFRTSIRVSSFWIGTGELFSFQLRIFLWIWREILCVYLVLGIPWLTG